MLRIIGLAVCFLFVFSCTDSSTNEYIQLQGEAQGTTFFISYYDSLKVDYSPQIEQILIDFDNQLSGYLKSSVISRFNNNEIDTIHLSEKTGRLFDCFKTSISIQKYTNGSFNHGLQNLIRANRYSSYSQGIYNKEIRDSILAIPSEVIMNDEFITKIDTNSQFSFDAIAQGQSVDIICAFFDSQGVQNYMVEIGGEVRVRGNNNRGKLWKISLEAPNSKLENRKVQETIRLNNESVVTSGSYRKFKIIEGVRYSHAINPKTGLGVTHNLLSVSVIAENCAIADALATSFLVMGREKSIEFLEKNNKYNAKLMFIESEGKEEYSTSFYGGFERHLVD
ncbi:MAG: FAD:protein FMN transferase [Flavobacteriales bacterium]